MASLAYILSGGAPVIKKFQFGVTLTAAGIPFTAMAAGTPGVVIGTTTGATNLVGFSLDKGLDRFGLGQSTYTTTQGSGVTSTGGANSALRTVTLIINPDAAWRLTMSQGATSSTALTKQATTSASSGGTAVTTGTDWTSPQYADGYVWGFDGANAGDARKITSTSATAGTVTIPFDYAIASGDNFLRCPYSPTMANTVQLTTDLTQADASIAVGTGAPYRVVELILRDSTDLGQTNSYVIVVSDSHVFQKA